MIVIFLLHINVHGVTPHLLDQGFPNASPRAKSSHSEDFIQPTAHSDEESRQLTQALFTILTNGERKIN